ncbi:hypothetical protein [Coraliomargarita parva]|uniref:hypothetical protein n=1 Tax=Coraliomargarita parva TaxID=3014050 RepID=UPI0022B3049A|nr:hypothetical protein [Coraliomargarita parva]
MILTVFPRRTFVPIASTLVARVILLILAGLWLAPICLWGQAVQQPESEGGATTVRMLLLTEKAQNLELYYSEKPELEIDSESGGVLPPSGPVLVGARGLSQALPCKGKALYMWLKDSASKDGFRLVSSIQIEASSDEFVVLLVPGAKLLKPYLINASLEHFQGGALLFFNTLDVPIAAQFNEEVTIVQPLDPVIAEAPEYEDKPWFGLRMYEPVSGGGAKVFCSRRRTYQQGVRSYYFIFRNSNNGRIDYRSINEFIGLRGMK